MKTRNTFWKPLALGLLVACAGLWVVIKVRAQTAPDSPDRPQFGMLGIARAQTARLSVVNIRAVPPEGGDRPGDSCRVQLKFMDGQGRMIKGAEVSLGPGQAEFLDVAHDDPFFSGGETRGVAPDSGDRHQIRAVFIAPDGADMPQFASSNFIGTVEVFGRDGKTTFLYPGFIPPNGGDVPAPR